MTTGCPRLQCFGCDGAADTVTSKGALCLNAEFGYEYSFKYDAEKSAEALQMVNELINSWTPDYNVKSVVEDIDADGCVSGTIQALTTASSCVLLDALKDVQTETRQFTGADSSFVVRQTESGKIVVEARPITRPNTVPVKTTSADISTVPIDNASEAENSNSTLGSGLLIALFIIMIFGLICAALAWLVYTKKSEESKLNSVALPETNAADSDDRAISPEAGAPWTPPQRVHDVDETVMNPGFLYGDDDIRLSGFEMQMMYSSMSSPFRPLSATFAAIAETSVDPTATTSFGYNIEGLQGEVDTDMMFRDVSEAPVISLSGLMDGSFSATDVDPSPALMRPPPRAAPPVMAPYPPDETGSTGAKTVKKQPTASRPTDLPRYSKLYPGGAGAPPADSFVPNEEKKKKRIGQKAGGKGKGKNAGMSSASAAGSGSDYVEMAPGPVAPPRPSMAITTGGVGGADLPAWFLPTAAKEQVAAWFKDPKCPVGTFLARNSSRPGNLAFCVKDYGGSVKSFLIPTTPEGGFVAQGKTYRTLPDAVAAFKGQPIPSKGPLHFPVRKPSLYISLILTCRRSLTVSSQTRCLVQY